MQKAKKPYVGQVFALDGFGGPLPLPFLQQYHIAMAGPHVWKVQEYVRANIFIAEVVGYDGAYRATAKHAGIYPLGTKKAFDASKALNYMLPAHPAVTYTDRDTWFFVAREIAHRLGRNIEPHLEALWLYGNTKVDWNRR